MTGTNRKVKKGETTKADSTERYLQENAKGGAITRQFLKELHIYFKHKPIPHR